MPIKRTYGEAGDGCMYAHAMDLIEDHWAGIIVRELLLGPKRFTDLSESVWGITPAVLTTRLEQLCGRGLVTTVALPLPARGRAYDLTPWGRQLEPIVLALGRWAQGSPTRPDVGELTPDGAALALLAMAPAQPMEPPIEIELHLTDRRAAHGRSATYRLAWDDRLRVARGTLADPPCVVRADATTLVRELLAGRRGELHVEGEAAALDRVAAALAGGVGTA